MILPCIGRQWIAVAEDNRRSGAPIFVIEDGPVPGGDCVGRKLTDEGCARLVILSLIHVHDFNPIQQSGPRAEKVPRSAAPLAVMQVAIDPLTDVGHHQVLVTIMQQIVNMAVV